MKAGGPVAGLLPIPEGHEAGSEDGDDALASLRSDIGKARGKALLVETTSSGFGEGRASAPARDWDPRYLHPSPTESMVKLADAAFGPGAGSVRGIACSLRRLGRHREAGGDAPVAPRHGAAAGGDPREGAF